jgi:hypothetical protein
MASVLPTQTIHKCVLPFAIADALNLLLLLLIAGIAPILPGLLDHQKK